TTATSCFLPSRRRHTSFKCDWSSDVCSSDLHPENNTVIARWFPAHDTTRRRAVVVLPQWNSDAGGHVGLSRLLARFGVSALRLRSEERRVGKGCSARGVAGGEDAEVWLPART